MVDSLSKLKIKIFADGANIEDILSLNDKNFINGFTTNPSLMRKAGIKDYEKFAKEILSKITEKNISFEVFADEISEMKEQALKISSWAKNVSVKIPITNTKGKKTKQLIRSLCSQRVMCNVTAIFTIQQVEELLEELPKDSSAILSIFAGRIADTGLDAKKIIKQAVNLVKDFPNIKILWASPREVYNLFDAEECGCHIITMQPDLINKLSLLNKDLNEYSLETVKAFYKDALSSSYSLK